MTTRDCITQFYTVLKEKGDWQSFFTDATNFINNGKQIQGIDAFLQGISRFYSMVQSFEVQETISSGNKASSVVRYHILTPSGAKFSSDVAEFFTLKEGKFQTFAIYFDTLPYPR
jgi:hypothetical protein